ncbi:uncharacterized protein BO95DRAFT_456347 [Aspergillus brunneoviolaceus CBS 621.78]|uniref:Uncharacterized protein n=1 Tax=Aspergillus brunneoviolaceus CBS 621.78 TaxID=1450534 RepID=A0ACD1FXV0_9EURO|nr:hypothetical protein BO95DRAFT_456347 [Aspergillus brunneoviolaceus CBS 621.78]RAH41782.1 hypothetical protein BO95DRAFT_456347 [Aspergillus brunneoviolaceus CBS 621.78]
MLAQSHISVKQFKMVTQYGIHQVFLASTISPADPVAPKSAQKEVQYKQKQTFNTCCRGNVNNNSPNPLLLPERLQRSVAKLHEALVSGLSSIVDTWWTNEQATFPRRMPLEPHEEDLLRICEINARYSINAQLLAAYGYQIYEEMAAERGCVFAGADARKFIKSQLDIFDPKYPIHIVRDQYRTPYIDMFVSFAEQSGRISATIIKSADLRLIKSDNSQTGYDLYCLSDKDCPDMVSTDGERLDRVYQTGLHLFQHELRSIPTDILRHLALHCVNDLRSVLLIHDKRILGVLLQELDSLVSKQVLTPEQAAILRHGVVPTINPGSLELSILIDQQSRSLIHKDKFIIKPVRSGRGDEILLGRELSVSQWESLLLDLRDPGLEPGRTMYIIQPLIEQPLFELLDHRGEVQSSPLVGSCHLANGSFAGLGFWRAGGTKICNLNSGGFWMLGVVARPN